MRAQQLRRVVGGERRGPDGPAGEHPRGAAAAGRLDRAREVVGLDALREHDPRAGDRGVDLAAAARDLAAVAASLQRHLALVERRPDRGELRGRLDDRGLAVGASRTTPSSTASRPCSRASSTKRAAILDTARALRVVAPDREILERNDLPEPADLAGPRACPRPLARGLHEASAARISPHDCRDEALGDDLLVPVVPVDQEARRVRARAPAPPRA